AVLFLRTPSPSNMVNRPWRPAPQGRFLTPLPLSQPRMSRDPRTGPASEPPGRRTGAPPPRPAPRRGLAAVRGRRAAGRLLQRDAQAAAGVAGGPGRRRLDAHAAG